MSLSDSVNDSLQAQLNGIHTMSASFKQVVNAKKHALMQSSGTMALSRPGHFRWQTKQPMSQLLIADGRRVWIYDADLEQVTVKKQSQNLSGTAGLFLSHYDRRVARDFNTTMSQKGKKIIYDLHSKSSKASFSRVKLSFDGNALVGIELFDQLGQYTKVSLSHVKTNIKLPMTQFQFKVPKGVDVVNQ